MDETTRRGKTDHFPQPHHDEAIPLIALILMCLVRLRGYGSDRLGVLSGLRLAALKSPRFGVSALQYGDAVQCCAT